MMSGRLEAPSAWAGWRPRGSGSSKPTSAAANNREEERTVFRSVAGGPGRRANRQITGFWSILPSSAGASGIVARPVDLALMFGLAGSLGLLLASHVALSVG